MIVFCRRVRWCNGNTAPFGGVIHGSNPCRTAKFTQEIDNAADYRTECAHISEAKTRKVKFPYLIKHRKAEATIYAKTQNYDFYRVIHRDSANRRVIRSFKTYRKAKAAADKTVRDLASGSQAPSMTVG